MGAPANPSAHPDNKQAATGGYTSQSNGAFRERDQTSKAEAASSVPGEEPQGSYVHSSPTGNPSGSMDHIRAQVTEFSKRAESIVGALWGHLSSQSKGSFRERDQASKAGAASSVGGQAPQGCDVHSSSTGNPSGSMDQIKAQVTEFSKRAELIVGNLWGNLSTGPSVADTAWGRMTAGTQLLTKGGFEGVFKATFPADADEVLKKTYACFLSTSTGPVAGTLYISSKKLAFCSDRPLSFTPPAGQQSFSYYGVIIPINKVRDVQPSVNQNKPAEKYMQVTTQDNVEFWFMGFVNYDKGVKNLQATVGTGTGNGVNHQTGGVPQQAPQQAPQEAPQQAYPPKSGESGSLPQPDPPSQSTNEQTHHNPTQCGEPNQHGYSYQNGDPNQYGIAH